MPRKRRESPLLGPGDNWQMNACLNYGIDGWLVYELGYRKAAEVLTAFVQETASHQDGLIFPVIFLWRHHLELKLKSISRAASVLVGRDWQPANEHDLSQLFTSTHALLKDVFAEFDHRVPASEMNDLRKAFAALKTIDSQSMTFRYPEDLGQQAHLEGVRYINYDRVTAFFTPVADALDNLELALDVFEDWRQDWLASQV